MTDQMRAWTFSQRGRAQDVLTLGSIPKPTITSPDQVLIKVACTSLFSSYKAIMALLPVSAGQKRVPEAEFSGEIVEYGENVREELKVPGLAVFGLTLPMEPKTDMLRFMRNPNGTLTEYVVVRQNLIVPKPANMSLEAASGMAGIGATAVQFADAAKLNTGDYVLVNGGSGAVGMLLLQLLKKIVGPEGKVVATCSGSKKDVVLQYADEAIDYRAHAPVHTYLAQEYGTRKFDAIIDAGSTQELYDHSPDYLNEGKCFLDMSAKHPVGRGWQYSDLLPLIANQMKNNFWPTLLGGVPRKYIFISGTPDYKTLQKIRELIEDGTFKGTIDSVYGMDEVIQAYDRFSGPDARGRVVVDVRRDRLHA
ncbi:chaperonin 10-like protein [Umbelopsis sp. AD052]|nr:chaperonin 10-like protein [Umbelopsis sp. AD052]